MPEIVGTLRPPRLASAPSSPALGEMYYDTVTNLLYFWNGTAWTSGGGGGGSGSVNTFEQASEPVAADVGDFWIDTDAPPPTFPALVGAPIPWLVSAIPDGYREFDGSAIVQTTHPLLYNLFGATIPDLRGLTLIGQGGTVAAAVGGTGGAPTHTLTVAQMPSHRHIGQSYNTTAAGGGGTPTWLNQQAYTVQDATTMSLTGSDQAHNNMQPYRAVRWITVAA